MCTLYVSVYIKYGHHAIFALRISFICQVKSGQFCHHAKCERPYNRVFSLSSEVSRNYIRVRFRTPVNEVHDICSLRTCFSHFSSQARQLKADSHLICVTHKASSIWVYQAVGAFWFCSCIFELLGLLGFAQVKKILQKPLHKSLLMHNMCMFCVEKGCLHGRL